MKLMPEYNEKMALHCIVLKNPNLGRGRKWRHCVYPVSVYQLILILVMAKILCHMITAAVP